MEIQLKLKFLFLKKFGFQIYVKEGVLNTTCHTEMEQGKYRSKQRRLPTKDEAYHLFLKTLNVYYLVKHSKSYQCTIYSIDIVSSKILIIYYENIFNIIKYIS